MATDEIHVTLTEDNPMSRSSDKWQTYIAEKLRETETRNIELQVYVASIEKKLDANTALTKEVLELFTSLKGGVKTAAWLGTFIKWAGGVIVGVSAFYTWWHK